MSDLFVTVFPDRFAPGASSFLSLYPPQARRGDGAPAQNLGRRLTIQAALGEQWPTDAHFAAYELTGPDGPLDDYPRLKKESLASLQAMGGQVLASLAVMDVDLHHLLPTHPRGKDLAWTDLPPDEALGLRRQILAQTPSVGPWAAVYTGKRGLRLVHALAVPVPCGEPYEALQARFRESWAAVGVPCDPACKDWTRLYRLPRVTRL